MSSTKRRLLNLEQKISMKRVSIRLTNDQIKATSTPYVLLPATEPVLDYSGMPTRLPIPLHGFGVLNTSGGAYGNVAAETSLELGWGSDFSQDIYTHLDIRWGSARLEFMPATYRMTSPDLGEAYANKVINPTLSLEDNFYDNALSLYISNIHSEAGLPFTGGHASNYLHYTVMYVMLDLRTGEFA
jgi:hypothetical protein